VSDRQFLTDLCKKYLNQKMPEHKNQQQVKYSEKSDDMLYSENEDIVGTNETASNISTESENNVFCTNCGNKILESAQFCTNCGKSPNATSHTNDSNYQQYSQPTQSAGGIWYLLPIFFGLIGGIIAWLIVRKNDSKKAKNCLIIGVIMMVIGLFGNWLMESTEMGYFLSGFVGQILCDNSIFMFFCDNLR